MIIRSILVAAMLRPFAGRAAEPLRFDLGEQPVGVYLVQRETTAVRRCLRVIKQSASSPFFYINFFCDEKNLLLAGKGWFVFYEKTY